MVIVNKQVQPDKDDVRISELSEDRYKYAIFSKNNRCSDI